MGDIFKMSTKFFYNQSCHKFGKSGKSEKIVLFQSTIMAFVFQFFVEPLSIILIFFLLLNLFWKSNPQNSSYIMKYRGNFPDCNCDNSVNHFAILDLILTLHYFFKLGCFSRRVMQFIIT